MRTPRSAVVLTWARLSNFTKLWPITLRVAAGLVSWEVVSDFGGLIITGGVFHPFGSKRLALGKDGAAGRLCHQPDDLGRHAQPGRSTAEIRQQARQG